MGVSGPHDWYRDAIFYEVPVRSFFDSNADGIGDFPGLTEKLDYIQQLGADCIWLLPMFPSPLKDDGYDISDFYDIKSEYGTLDDFRHFLDAAHARGIRVITDLVMNHTSDQHPWFQEARRSPASPKRDYYVWSDDPERYAGTRIIFTDTETSNWSWDPVAGTHYWHRFFSHQPDLNYDSPHVRDAMLDVVSFWLGMGLDGLRCDAVPYLYERDGSNGENLPETHDFLRQLRAFVDRNYPGSVLLAEANQWPADVRAYFGDGDEFHMAFHFPLMPRLFMALRREDRTPIIEILDQTPAIPEPCQWGLFLRNHDELTLEMVTDADRDYMYLEYARDPVMRLNLGIRRRLAPLMENGRRQMELLNSLLLSMPGSPIIYYGDELGMGDNIYLGDRGGVRTPMQWSGDKNAGFSRTDPARLFSPVILDPVYHYEALNVESQTRVPTSLLNWMRRLIAVRKRYPVFGRGSIEFLLPTNTKVLAYIRKDATQTVLCVVNLSRFVQPVELDLSRYKGAVPVELIGETTFPAIGDLPYFLTLGPHGFYWFRLEI
jgi:maltose alpha-D-glucosyltransferase/alpha-amylase